MKRMFFYEKEEQEPEAKYAKGQEEGKKFNKLLLGLLAVPLLAVLLIAAAFAIIYFEKDKDTTLTARMIPAAELWHRNNSNGTGFNGTGNATEEYEEAEMEEEVELEDLEADEDSPYVYSGDEYEEENDYIPTLMPHAHIVKEGDIKLIPVSSEGAEAESYTKAVEKCKALGGDLAVADTEEQLEKIYKAVTEDVPETIKSPMVFTGMRFTLDDWVAQDGSVRIYNGVVSSLWDESYSSAGTDTNANCSIMSEANDKFLLTPVGCNHEVNCYICERRGSEKDDCDYGICYDLNMEETTIEEASESCIEKKAKLALPASFLMLDRLQNEIADQDVNKKCKKIAIGFVRDIHLQDFAGNPVNISLDPFTEQRTKLTDSCVGFDLILSKQFTRASCKSPNGAICIVPNS